MPGEMVLNQEGFQNLSVTVAVATPTLPTVTLANEGRTAAKSIRHATFRCTVAPVRYRGDGTNPTSTVGSLLSVGEILDLTEPLTDFSGFINRLRFIRDTSAVADATVECTYYG